MEGLFLARKSTTIHNILPIIKSLELRASITNS